jgi:hypothetical protein
MKEGWTNIYAADQEFKAKLAEDVLKQNDIVSHIMTKPDSAIPSLGAATLYVQNEDVEAAVKILKEENILTE